MHLHGMKEQRYTNNMDDISVYDAIGNSLDDINQRFQKFDIRLSLYDQQQIGLDAFFTSVQQNSAAFNNFYTQVSENSAFYKGASDLVYNLRDYWQNPVTLVYPKTFAVLAGYKDIENRTLRVIGQNPEERLKEDYLRILRIFRFACELDFKIQSESLLAAQKLFDGLRKISNERIKSELLRIFPHPKGWGYLIDWCANGFIHSLLKTELVSSNNHKISEPENLYIIKEFWVRLIVLLTQSGLTKLQISHWIKSFPFSRSELKLSQATLYLIFEINDFETQRMGQQLEWIYKNSILDVIKFISVRTEKNTGWIINLIQKYNSIFNWEPIVKSSHLPLVSGQSLGDTLKQCYWIQLENNLEKADQILNKLKG